MQASHYFIFSCTDLLDPTVLQRLKLPKPMMLIPLDSHNKDLSNRSTETKLIARESKLFFDYYGFPMKVGYFSGKASSLLHFNNKNLPFSLDKAFTLMISVKPLVLNTTGNILVQLIDKANKTVLQLSYYQSNIKLR